MIDAEVPAFWRALGIPGLADIHVHFMPKPVMDAVWRHFDDAPSHYGTAWPVHYRGSDEERLARLRALGVRVFPALLYPHKPDMAAWLTDWALSFAASVPECVPTGTFYPEPTAADYVRTALDRGARIFKVPCRWRSSTRAIRSSTRCGVCWRTRARRSSCTAAAARWPGGSPAPGRSVLFWLPTRG